MLSLLLACRPIPEVHTLSSLEPGVVVVPVSVGDRSLSMMIDTGAELTALTARGASALGLSAGEGQPSRKVQTANGTVDAPVVRLPPLTLAGRTHDTATGLLCADCPEAIDGLIGMNVLAAYDVFVDADRNTVTLSPRSEPPDQRRDVAPWLSVTTRRKPLADAPGVRIAVTNSSPWPIEQLQLSVACAPRVPALFADLGPGEHRALQINTPDEQSCADLRALTVAARWSP